jgi:hypothetical protein
LGRAATEYSRRRGRRARRRRYASPGGQRRKLPGTDPFKRFNSKG